MPRPRVGITPISYPYLWATVVIAAVGLSGYLIPAIPRTLVTRYNDDFAFALIGAVVASAMVRRARLATGLEERRLWGWLACSFAVWGLAELVESFVPELSQPATVGLTADVLYFCSYSAWFLGVNQAPHHPSGWTSRQPGWRLEQWGTLIFSLGLAADLVVVPQLVDPQDVSSRMLSAGLYVALDVVVLTRLVVLAKRTSAPEWRSWYGMMTVMAAGLLVLDTLAAAMDYGMIATYHGPLYDLAWYLPFCALAITCSLPTPQPAQAMSAAMDLTVRQAEEGASPTESGLALYASAFVVIHILADLTPAVAPASAGPRAVCALLVILALGLVVFLRYRSLENRVRELAEDLQRATQTRHQIQKMDAIARLAGGVAHDFGNLLTIIMGHGEFVMQGLPKNAAVRSDLGHMQNAARRAARLTSDLLSVGRGHFGQSAAIDLSRFLRELTPTLQETTGPLVVLVLHPDPTAPAVFMDASQLRDVVLKLTVNAREAMAEGGCLTITIERVTGTDQSVAREHPLPPGEYVRLSLADTGAGMDSLALSRAFEPFHSTKGFGRGLGLATVHGTIRRTGGTISVESELGQGTRFDILLPAAPADSRAAVRL